MAGKTRDLITETGEHFDVIIASPAAYAKFRMQREQRARDRLAANRRTKDELTNCPIIPDGSKGEPPMTNPSMELVKSTYRHQSGCHNCSHVAYRDGGELMVCTVFEAAMDTVVSYGICDCHIQDSHHKPRTIDD